MQSALTCIIASLCSLTSDRNAIIHLFGTTFGSRNQPIGSRSSSHSRTFYYPFSLLRREALKANWTFLCASAP
ncbi:hypothetical protein BDR07DRAFT_557667 [Suillus spraguei]|nr:hypothetical protein BDR07DRAFT_557667 [Suillus spraguei]